MEQYDVRFVNHAGAIFSDEKFRAVDDARAIIRARTIFRSPIGMGYEIWHGERLVHRETY